jgi:hypothetical protein
MGAFVVSITASEVLREHIVNDGILVAASAFMSYFLAYAVGRMLIEPDIRFVTVRRFVVLILLLGPVGLYEWRLGQNPYGVIGQRIFHLASVQSAVQYRDGHGRVSASFNDAELAGIIFGMAAMLNVWLVYLRKWRPAVDLGKIVAALERFHLPGLLLCLYLYFTRSRGPLLAVGVGYLILQIPKFKHKKVAMAVAAILIAIATAGAYRYFSQYTNISDPGAIVNEQQGSALYRRQMIERYQPIVSRGNWLGWGLLSHPIVPGMFSVDNEYLLIHLAYGHSGYILFILIGAETFRRLIMCSWRLKTQEDQAFAIALLGAMAVFWISIVSVYMGEQIPQVAFLLVGWSASLSATDAAKDSIHAKFAFNRIFK